MKKIAIGLALVLSSVTGAATAAAPTGTAEPQARIELLRDGRTVWWGLWMFRDLANGSISPYNGWMGDAVPLGTCASRVGGGFDFHIRYEDVGTRLHIKPLKATPEGYEVNVQLDDTHIKAITAKVSADGCQAQTLETDGLHFQRKAVPVARGQTTEVTFNAEAARYVVRVTLER
ncbi:hypothetical protein [Cupriavidus sp. TMH.W2]|uniref:hypothetical protein n=1 Tax=Cupriavidus sp. TMH.W2 TaxID=3434465 RepID=UPI003D778E41